MYYSLQRYHVFKISSGSRYIVLYTAVCSASICVPQMDGFIPAQYIYWTKIFVHFETDFLRRCAMRMM